jgi:hypothetical protein
MGRILVAVAILLGVLGSPTAAGAVAPQTAEVAPVTVPMIDGVTEVDRGTASISIPGATGVESAQLEYALTGLVPGQSYHLIAYCTEGSTATCTPIQYVPGLVDYIHDLGTATADAAGRIDRRFTVDPLPLGSYGWHVVAARPGFERYAVIHANVTRHIHNSVPHEAQFTVQVTYTGLCNLARQYETKDGVANSLCAKLRAAAASETRGSASARAGQLSAYIREVAAQRGKSLTDAQADTLTRYAQALLAESVSLANVKAKAAAVAKSSPGPKRGFAALPGNRRDD